MRRVADRLTQHAQTEQDKALQALFAKSACNRYYYHCWLSVREEIKSLITSARPKHGPDVGNMLQASYQKKIFHALDAVNPPDVLEKKTRLSTFIKDISSLMGKLYSIRQAADYEETSTIIFTQEDVEIQFQSDGKFIAYSIQSVVTDLETISAHLNEIRNIKREVGLE